MSTGLGKMQAAILAALEPAKRAHAEGKLEYRGGAHIANFHSEQGEKQFGKPREQIVRSSGQDRPLPAHVFDLRAVLAYLSREMRAGRRVENPLLQTWDVDRRFAVSFSRAVRTLIERGELVRQQPDGARVREIRFVSRRP